MKNDITKNLGSQKLVRYCRYSKFG